MELGAGVIVVRGGGKTRVCVRSVPDLVGLVGENLMVAFTQAFLGAEHIEALQHALVMNNKLDRESIAYMRNLRTFAAMIYGLMREIADALAALEVAGVRSRLSRAKDNWTALAEIRDRWSKDPTAKAIRHGLVFHQDQKLIRQALKDWPASEPLALIESDDRLERRANTHVAFPITLAFGSVPMERSFVEQALKDHPMLSGHLLRVFADVLRGVGVRFLDDEPGQAE